MIQPSRIDKIQVHQRTPTEKPDFFPDRRLPRRFLGVVTLDMPESVVRVNDR